MGLEVREVGPIETPGHRDTVYLLATTVPPTVVALRPKRAETVARAQIPQMGIDPGRHRPMQIIPSMHVKSPEAIITDEGEKPSRAQRAAPAAWRSVGRRLPRPLRRASAISGAPIGLPRGPRAGRGGSGTLPWGPKPGSAAAPSPRPRRRRTVGHHRRWRRHLPSGTACPGAVDVPAVAPRRIGGPVVLNPLQPRWSRPRRRPPPAPSGLRLPLPRRACPRRPPLRDRRRRPSPRPRRDRPGAAQSSPLVRRCRRACGSRTTRTAGIGETRPVRRAPFRWPAPGPRQRPPRRPS